MIGPGRALFDRFPSASRPTSAIEPLGNAGGLSGAGLYRFESLQGPIVARLWPVDGPDRSALARIHAWLGATGDQRFVPVPIAALDGSTIVESDGRIWELAPWMPGLADLSRPPASAKLRAGFAGLARFLTRLADEQSFGPSPGLARRAAELDRLILFEFAEIRASVIRGPIGPASSLTLRWLDRAVLMAPAVQGATRKAASRPMPLQPCLRDVRPDHFLFEGDRLTGLVDFGAMGVDSVAGDLARLLGEWVGPSRLARLEALASFEAIRPLSSGELQAIGEFQAANALLGSARWARWHFLERRKFADPNAVVRGLTRGLERLDEANQMGAGPPVINR